MKSFLSTLILTLLFFNQAVSQCEVTGSVNPGDVVCGDCALLSAFGRGQGTQVFGDNFNTGAFSAGWGSTQQALFNNPCSPQGVDGTTHVWMGNAGPVPRYIETRTYDLTSATSGVTICFDMLFATQTGDPATAPCEGPDEPDEGVHLQYRIGNGPWIDIHYFDPNGGSDPQLTNWNNWCFQLPQAAITTQTQIRFFQDFDSGADYDHWGIDNFVIYYNDPNYYITWLHDNYNYGVGISGGVNPNPVCPRTNTDYIVRMTNNIFTCYDTVSVTVATPTVTVVAEPDTTVCAGECASLSGTAKVVKRPAKTPTYFNGEVTPIINTFGTISNININITDLNMTNVLPGSITQVCITSLTYFGFGFPNPATIGDLVISLVCPDGTKIRLIPSGVTTSTTPLQGYTNTCFTPAATASIGSASPPYTGTFMPNQPFSNLNGCTANGVWSIEVTPAVALGFGFGSFFGWNITFNDPEISYPATFTWSPTTNMTNSNTLTPNVCPPSTQTYTLTAQDTAGCVVVTDDVTITVDQNCCNLAFTASSIPPSCGGSNGSIAVNVISGSGSYSYLLNGNIATPPFTGLPSGVYDIEVIDQTQGCQRDTAITLQPSNAPVIDTVMTTHETCFNAHDGTASVTASGGTGGITFQWSTTQAGSSITGLAPGAYSVTARDGSGCTATATFVILPGPVCCSLQIASMDTTSETCLGQNNGTAGVTVTGATGSVTYNWSSTAQTTPSVTGLSPGSHSVTVTDASGCADTATFTIAAGPDCCNLQVSPQLTNPNCGQNNGAIILTVTGGSGNYLYEWSNSAITKDIFNLFAGSYTVIVHDTTLNCDDTTTINLSNSNANAPVIDAITATAETCRGSNDGTATVVASSGNGALSYLWNNSRTTATITGLAPGNYSVTVSDTLGCQAVGSVVVPVGPVCCALRSSASATDTRCNTNDGAITVTVDVTSGTPPFSYTIDGINFGSSSSFNNLAAGTYYPGTRDADQCLDIDTVTIVEANNTIVISMDSTNISCFGSNDGIAQVNISGGVAPVTVQWSTNSTNTTIINLGPGVYSVTVSDGDNCRQSDSVTIVEPAEVIATITGRLDFCAGDSSTLDAGVFSEYIWSTGDTTQTITVKQAGAYTVTVYDANVCPDENSVTVTVNPLPTADAGPGDTIYDFETVTLTPAVNGTVNPSGFWWTPDSTLSCGNCMNPVASPDSTIRYHLTYRDLNGCMDTASVLITVIKGEFYALVPNAFSPNGDGNNEILYVYHAGIKKLVFRIFNRWGSLIFETRNPDAGWDGTFKGKLLDPSVFVFELYAEFINFNLKPLRKTGSVTLLR